jgi:signal transduction histidine kinase/DNA-binding response OmpR family regulator
MHKKFPQQEMAEEPGMIRGMRAKVYLGFGLVLAAAILAAIINISSLNKMSGAVADLSRRDEKGQAVRILLSHLANQETAVRAFSLSADSLYLEKFYQQTDSVRQRLKLLQFLTAPDSRQQSIVDSISQKVDQRHQLFTAFIESRRIAMLQEQSGESDYAAEKTRVSLLPAAKPDAPSNVAITDTTAHVVSEKKKKGLLSFNWMKDVFGSKEKKQGKKKGEAETTGVDTIPPQADTLKTPRPALSGTVVQTEETGTGDSSLLYLKLQAWNAGDLLLALQNQEMMDSIRRYTWELGLLESEAWAQQANEASAKALQSRRLMVAITLIGILGTLLFIYLLLRDITIGKRLRLQLENETQRAEKLAKVKEEFLANMSHEIRTPLNSIVGYSDLLLKESSGERKQEFMNAIQKSSRHLLSLVNQILDFSRLEAGKLEPAEVTFNFHDLVREVYETFRFQATKKNVSFTYENDGRIPLRLFGDAMSLKQILLNLVSNAVKFTSEGSVSMRSFLERENNQSVRLRIEISDTGIGIPGEAKDKIFSAFTQSNNNITRRFGGTGLGLAISKRLTELLGGSLQVESEEGKGSAFSITVPFSKKEEKRVATKNKPELKAPDRSGLRGKHILVVDDEEMNVRLCKVILENHGLLTSAAHHGRQALEMMEKENFDLVLLDIQMPELSGYEVIRKIRAMNNEQKSGLPVIALTANIFGPINQTYAEAGFTDQLIKPFDENALIEKISRHLLVNSGVSVDDDPDTLSPPSTPFSIRYLRKVSGSHDGFVISMLQSFIESNRPHLQQLQTALLQKDAATLAGLAHKMIPSFRYLEVAGAEEQLRELESASKNEDWEKTGQLVSQIVSQTETLFPLLSQLVIQLKQEGLRAERVAASKVSIDS